MTRLIAGLEVFMSASNNTKDAYHMDLYNDDQGSDLQVLENFLDDMSHSKIDHIKVQWKGISKVNLSDFTQHFFTSNAKI